MKTTSAQPNAQNSDGHAALRYSHSHCQTSDVDVFVENS